MKSYLFSMFFLNLAHYVKLLFNMALIGLGLLEPLPPEGDYHPRDDYILLTDSRSRFIVSVPVQVLMVMIKDNLPILEYGHFIKRFGNRDDEQMENGDDKRVCRVCLESMERSDEMRQLCMCSHVFHKECIDAWINEGRVTCPLCRATLYPDPMVWFRSCNRLVDCN